MTDVFCAGMVRLLCGIVQRGFCSLVIQHSAYHKPVIQCVCLM